MKSTDTTALTELIKSEHIRIVHLFDHDYPYGGCTIAYKPERFDGTGYPIGKFARVAVAYCSPLDRYSRKLGRHLAVSNLLVGENILMPIYINGTPVKDLQTVFSVVFNNNV
jgi:hypothetical protein